MRQTFADKVRELREAKGWTQDDLAEAAQLNRVTVAKYETGKIEPKSKTLGKLATALGVDANYLLDQSAKMSDEERELWEIRNAARQDAERKILFMLAKNGSSKDVKQVVAIIDALKATNPDFYDGDEPS